MAEPLALDTEERFEQGWYVAERVLIALIVLALALGLAGVLSRGPLTRSSAAVPGQVSAAYDLFLHQGAPTTLDLDAAPGASGALEVRLDRAFLQRFRLTSTTPQASLSGADLQGALYLFRTGPGGGRVSLQLRPIKPGPADVALEVGRARLQLHPFVLP